MLSLDVIILAAGKGTRMKTLLPKVLHKVCGITLIERAIRASLCVNPNRIVSVLGYQADAVKAHINKLNYDPKAFSDKPCHKQIELMTVIQEPQMGTGHAVQVALSSLSNDAEFCLIIPGDTPLLEGSDLSYLANEFEQRQLNLAFFSLILDTPASFGRIIRDDSGKVVKIIEAKDCDRSQLNIGEINSSIYISRVSFLKEAIFSLKSDNAQGEIYLTDIVKWGVDRGYQVDAFPYAGTENSPSSSPDHLMGANSIAELMELEKTRRNEINMHLMNSGVIFEDFSNTYIDEDVAIASDCFIGANSRIRGKTKIEAKVRIDGDSLIEDSIIGEGSHIKLGSVIESSVVGQSNSIGPYAHLREGTYLSENVKLGNFVETKNSSLSKGVKAGHLTYLGDTTVGEDTNIGAGTITCNYDGNKKHQTNIGKNVFVGSNTAIVAPVIIGDDSFVAAGSTITKDIPTNALGIARAKQVVIKSNRFRKK